MSRLHLQSFGPIKSADISFGQLTVFVGPQASGKGLVLKCVKLLNDANAILSTLRQYDASINDSSMLVNSMFGEGIDKVFNENTWIKQDGKPIDLKSLVEHEDKKTEERVFFIPSHRMLGVDPQSGWFRGFCDYSFGTPFVVRDFGEKTRQFVQQELSQEGGIIFPKRNRLNKVVRKLLHRTVFDDFNLLVETRMGQKRLVLQKEKSPPIPFTVWSSGQREFMPIVLSAYQLLHPQKKLRSQSVELVIIEDIEMGLHPSAVVAGMLLVLDLIQAGYRVCLSTHSQYVLDVVWALQNFRRSKVDKEFVYALFGVTDTDQDEMEKLAATALDPQKVIKTYYFDNASGIVRDISNLDPASENVAEASWGGITGFSGHAGNLVARAVANCGIYKQEENLQGFYRTR